MPDVGGGNRFVVAPGPVTVADTGLVFRSTPLVLRGPSWSAGMLLPALGHGRCYRCRRPWWACAEHVVTFPGLLPLATDKHFALCDRCWDRSDVQARVQAHRWVLTTNGGTDRFGRWTRLETAIRAARPAEAT